jgi:catechol 2,3-dioxygenase-like lactoylglutathione lyase family enzyme
MSASLRCEIFPADLVRTVDFYVRVLDFTLIRDERDDAAPYVYLTRGEVRVGAVPAWAPSPARDARTPPIGVELVLEVDDVEAERERVAAAAWPVDQELTSRPWGLRDFRVLDPDGYYWRVTNRAEA